MKNNGLLKELREAGADKKEANELTRVATGLKPKKPAQLSERTLERIKGIPGHKERRSLLTYYAFGGSFAVLAIVVLFAQSAMPGTVLYNVKRGAEEVRTLVQPGFTDDLVEKRKEELELLRQEAAPQDRVKKAEAAYKEAVERSNERRRRRGDRDNNWRERDWDNWNWHNNDSQENQEADQPN